METRSERDLGETSMEPAARKNPIPKRDWRRAFRIIKNVIEDPDRTDEVIEIIDALAGPSFEKNFRRWAKHPEGQALLRDRPNLLRTLADRDSLKAMPEGSFGRVYADFMDRAGISPEGLVAAAEQAHEKSLEELGEGFQFVEDEERMYYGNRLRDQHDLWHVLTGYGQDTAGEAANLAFSVAQIPNLGMTFLVATSVFVVQPRMKLRWAKYVFQAWRRGRAVPKRLNLACYEELLPLPLDEVRAKLGIPPQKQFHPDGVGVLIEHKDGDPEILWKFTHEPAVATVA